MFIGDKREDLDDKEVAQIIKSNVTQKLSASGLLNTKQSPPHPSELSNSNANKPEDNPSKIFAVVSTTGI